MANVGGEGILTNLGLMESRFTGCAGDSRNLQISIANASAIATLTADIVIVGEPLAGRQYRISAVNKTLNLLTVGAGGIDTGIAPKNGWVALYLIFNPSTGNSALLATDTTSVIAPTIYAGVNLPAGYTASALVSVWRTTSTGQFRNGYQRGRRFSTPPSHVLVTTANPGGYTWVGMSAQAPKNAISVTGYAFCNSGDGGGSATLRIAADANGVGFFQAYAGNSGPMGGDIQFEILMSQPQTIYYDFSWSTPGVSNATIGVSGYTI